MARMTRCMNCQRQILRSHESVWERFHIEEGVEHKMTFCFRPECRELAAKAWVKP